ncbi:apolipoprotein D-like [Brevipalpus obovatus]|uniref:apolipoprotein D-like n=1 Tax=Brevipalpus obovatus TaxID=246614 RepID=UPI003D9F9163
MPTKIFLLFSFCFFGSVIGKSILDGKKCPIPVTPSPSFKIDDFVGLWYETERSLEPFELGWDCSSFNYTHVSGNKFLVDMNGQKDGKKVANHGTATNDDKTPYVLNLKFGQFDIPDPQWIVEMDAEKGYALVFTCFDKIGPIPVQIKFAWIMSRTRTLDKAIADKLHKKLETLGMAASSLQPVKQEHCLK